MNRRLLLAMLISLFFLGFEAVSVANTPAAPKEPPPKEKKGDKKKPGEPKGDDKKGGPEGEEKKGGPEGDEKKGDEPKPEDQKADDKKAEEKKPDEYLGEHVWGPHISKADLQGKVLVCVAFDGEDRTALAIPQMAISQNKDAKNLQGVVVLTDKAKLTKALRLATATSLTMPMIADAKLPDLKLEKDDKGKTATTLLVRDPSGRVIFSGKPDRGKAQSTVQEVKKALEQYPTPVLGDRTYSKLQAVVRQLAGASSYSSIVASLKSKEKSKDATEKEEARLLAYNIENYGAALLKKAEYFEPIHLPTAQDTYNVIAKAFKGMDAGKKADERLKAIKDDKTTTQELAACKLADQIRAQAGLLGPAKGAEAVDLGNPECVKAPFNKSATKVLQDAATFRKKYKDTRIAKEFEALMTAYGVKDTAPAK